MSLKSTFKDKIIEILLYKSLENHAYLVHFFFSQLDLQFMNSFIKTWTSEKAKMIYQIP